MCLSGHLRPLKIGLGLIRSWMTAYLQDHTCDVGNATTFDFGVMRLIDVKKICLILASSLASARYVALSYVWGEG
jgi:hypothetical protein